MKRWGHRVWVGCVLTAVLSITYAYAGVNDGLIAHYPFAGSASDASGTNNGVVRGSATSPSEINCMALSLAKEGDYVTIPPNDRLGLNSESRTISVWFKPGQQLHSHNAILDKTSISDYALVVLTNADPNVLKLRFRAHDGTKFRAISAVIPASQWVNAMIVKNGANISLYTNGNLAGTIAVSSVLTKNKPLVVGAGGSPYTPGYSFTGLIRDLRFYDRALTQDEVQTLYASSRPDTRTLSSTHVYPPHAAWPTEPTTPTVPTEPIVPTFPTAPIRTTVSIVKRADFNGIVISWPAIVGKSYQVQYKEDVGAPTWIDLGDPIVATSESMTYSDLPSDSSPNRFYQVVLLP